jgi:hypothetical protein
LILPLFSEQYRPKKLDSVDLNMQLVGLITLMVKGNDHYQEEMLRARSGVLFPKIETLKLIFEIFRLRLSLAPLFTLLFEIQPKKGI